MTNQRDIENAVEKAATDFQNLYLDYVNNFITVKAFADYHGLTEKDAENKIMIGRKIHNQRTGSL